MESVWTWDYVFANVGRNNSLWDIHWLSLRNTFSYSAAVNSFPMGSWKTMLQFLDFMQLQRVASNEVTSLGYFKFSLPRKWRKWGSTEKYLNSHFLLHWLFFGSSRYNSAIGGLAKNAEWMQARLEAFRFPIHSPTAGGDVGFMNQTIWLSMCPTKKL